MAWRGARGTARRVVAGRRQRKAVLACNWCRRSSRCHALVAPFIIHQKHWIVLRLLTILPQRGLRESTERCTLCCLSPRMVEGGQHGVLYPLAAGGSMACRILPHPDGDWIQHVVLRLVGGGDGALPDSSELTLYSGQLRADFAQKSAPLGAISAQAGQARPSVARALLGVARLRPHIRPISSDAGTILCMEIG